jgi:cobalt/nickel transport system ATP-binding protein
MILEAKNLNFIYPDGTKALNDLSIKIPKGKKLALLGPNGAGKSTLFLHFNGILQPQFGELSFAGKSISYQRRELKKLRKSVGIAFQDPDKQLFSASVLEEISFGPFNLGLSESEVKNRVDEAMSTLGISDLKDRPTHLLSYGQKKRVSIASILAMKPKVIIFDEPTVWLDPRQAEEMIVFFNQLQQKGITVIISTHNVDLAYSWADYIYVMKAGKLIGEGIAEEVFQDELLMSEASLVQPWLVEVYQGLKQKGLVKDGRYIPRNKKELLKLIDS